MLYIICGAAGFAFGFIAMYVLAVCITRSKQRRFEFSKWVLKAVMATYFIGLFFGMYAVNKILTDYPEYAVQALIALFGYVGTPISVAIGFYSWKAKNENQLKIKHGKNIKRDSEINVE